MSRRISNVWCVVLLVLVLSACTSFIESEVYLRDLDEVAEEELTSNLFIHVPLPSLDSCSEYQERYANIWRQSSDFQTMEFSKCHTRGWDNFIEYKMSIPLRSLDPIQGSEAMEGPMEIVLRQTDSGHRALYLRVDPNSLHNLDSLLYEEFFEKLNLADTAPLIQLSNDLRESQTLVIANAFVQNEPVLTPQSFTLQPRDSLDIVLSDVASAWIFTASPTAPPRVALVGIWPQTE